MGDKTGIKWTSATWNPVVGCSIESPACTHCYAMEQAHRIVRMSAAQGRISHYAGTTVLAKGNPVWTGKLVRAPEHIFLQPMRWTTPRMVFVNSMSDVFHPDMPKVYVDVLFAVMRLSGRHTFQILTKRPAVMRAWMNDPATPGRVSRWARLLASYADHKGRIPKSEVEDASWPPRNVWLGCTIEDQKRADERMQDLLSTMAAIRFISVEPMLSMVDLRAVKGKADDGSDIWFDALDAGRAGRFDAAGSMIVDASVRPSGADGVLPKLDWAIVGGESGDRARPMHPEWPRKVRNDCAETGTAYFFKQWGAWSVVEESSGSASVRPPSGAAERCVDIRGGRDPAAVGAVLVRKGRQIPGIDDVIDGVEHKAFPIAA